MKQNICILLGIVLILCGCKNTNEELKSQLRFERISSQSIVYEGENRDKILFTGNDIESYDWENQVIVFTDAFTEQHKTEANPDDILMNGSKLLSLYYPERFVIYIGEQEIYQGFVEPEAFISFYPGGPTIVEENLGSIRITCTNSESDTRYDDDLSVFLKKTDLLE